MTPKQQDKLAQLHREVKHLQTTISEGSRLVRWMKKRRTIPRDAMIRIGVDVHSATREDWRTAHIFADLPMEIAYKALIPEVEAMVAEAKKQLTALKPEIA